MGKNKNLLTIHLPDEEPKTLFEVEFVPVIDLGELADVFNVNSSDLEKSIKEGKFKEYTFKKEGNQYLGKILDGEEFYVSGIGLK